MPGRDTESYGFEAAGWTEFNQPDDTLWYEPSHEDQERARENEPDNPFAALPSDLDPHTVEGIWVHAYSLDSDDEHYFWVRTYMALDWDQWYDAIANTLDMHSMSLA